MRIVPHIVFVEVLCQIRHLSNDQFEKKKRDYLTMVLTHKKAGAVAPAFPF